MWDDSLESKAHSRGRCDPGSRGTRGPARSRPTARRCPRVIHDPHSCGCRSSFHWRRSWFAGSGRKSPRPQPRRGLGLHRPGGPRQPDREKTRFGFNNGNPDERRSKRLLEATSQKDSKFPIHSVNADDPEGSASQRQASAFFAYRRRFGHDVVVDPSSATGQGNGGHNDTAGPMGRRNTTQRPLLRLLQYRGAHPNGGASSICRAARRRAGRRQRRARLRPLDRGRCRASWKSGGYEALEGRH